MDSTSPPALDLTSWGNAWLAGHVGLDDAVDAVEHRTGPCVLVGLQEEPGELPLRRGLAELRRAGLRELRLALPVPGDPLGLAGPAEFNLTAIDAGEAVIAVCAGPRARAPDASASPAAAPGAPDTGSAAIGLTPAVDRRGSSYLGLRWTAHQGVAAPRGDVSLAEADHELTRSVVSVGERLVAGGGPAAWRPQVAEVLAELRGRMPTDGAFAPGYPARAHRLVALTDRLAMVIDAAMSGAAEGISAHQTADRDAALRELDRAVRRARVAACHSVRR